MIALAGMLAQFVADRINELRAWAQSKDETYEPAPRGAEPASDVFGNQIAEDDKSG
jgi:hypothetical protein